jgi:receptor protein-tyrosine kinase
MQTEPIFDIGDLLLIIWNKKFRIIITAGLIASLLVYYILQMPRIYSAKTTLLLGDSSSEFSLPQGLASLATKGDSKLNTYLQYMRSRQFAEQVVKDSGLMFRSELVAQQQPEQARILGAAMTLQAGLAFSRLGETNMVDVSFESESSQLAADVVNAVGPTFFSYQQQRSQKRAQEATLWLNQQFDEVQQRLEDSEVKLQKYFLENRLIDLASQISLASSEISTYMSQRIKVDAQANEMKTMISQFEASGDDVQGLLNVGFIVRNKIVQDLRKRILDEEEDLAEISRRYKYKHPRYIAQVSKIDAMTLELDSLVGKLVKSLKQEYKIMLERSADIGALIDEAKGRHSELGLHEVNLAKIRREVESTQKLYDIFLSRLQETEILRDLGTQEEFSVVDFASVPASPSKPNLSLLLAASLVLAVFMSVMGWLFLHIVSDRRSRIVNVLKTMDVPILSEIPRLSKAKRSLSSALQASREDLRFAESIRTLRTALTVRSEEEDNRLIAITGVKSNDGKSLIAASLGESFARLEKALILDANLRYPSISAAYQFKQERVGLTHFISKTQSAGKCIHRIADTQLSVMPNGIVPQDPMVYIAKPRFKAFLHKLGIIFGRVIVDAPALTQFSDALVIGRNVDAIVLVCDIETTDSAEIVQAIQQLRDVGAPLKGVVFNRVKHLSTRFPQPGKKRMFLSKLRRKIQKPKTKTVV